MQSASWQRSTPFSGAGLSSGWVWNLAGVAASILPTLYRLQIACCTSELAISIVSGDLEAHACMQLHLRYAPGFFPWLGPFREYACIRLIDNFVAGCKPTLGDISKSVERHMSFIHAIPPSGHSLLSLKLFQREFL